MGHNLRERIFRLLVGAVFAGCGVLILYLTLTNNLSDDTSTLMSFLAAMMFIVAGVWASGILEWFVRTPDKIHGLFIAFMGLMLVLFSLLDDPESFHAPRWVVTAAGLTFAFPGLWMILNSISSTYFLKDLLVEVLRNMIVTSFALAAIGVVASVTVGSQPDLQAILCFLPGALLLTLLAIRLWRPTIKQFREKATTADPAQKRHLRILTGWLIAGLVVYIGLFILALLVENGGILTRTPELR
jgi:hypothetical protein